LQTPAAGFSQYFLGGIIGDGYSLIKPQSTLAGPPLGKARDKLAASAVHELRIAKARPSIDSGEKFLFNSAWWPKAAN
jgi:hypothetical protein